ncbi:MAG: hypothetical protein IT378_14685 [Sandaracinaceae bacterium]|nr:hypothetical protein [Sandaracinaceae bacterium]
MRLLGWAFALGLFGALLGACDGTVSVTFMTGRQDLELSTGALALPTELRDGDRVASVSCGPSGVCPPSDLVTLSCEAGTCDPAPKTLAYPIAGVFDVDAVAPELDSIASRVVSYDIEELQYDVLLNTLTVGTGPVEIFWGPEAAVAIDESQGVVLLGTMPAIRASETSRGEVAIDPQGMLALSDHLVSRSRRFRLFARTVVDLDPGDPFPEGLVRMTVNGKITVVGSIVR